MSAFGQKQTLLRLCGSYSNDSIIIRPKLSGARKTNDRKLATAPVNSALGKSLFRKKMAMRLGTVATRAHPSPTSRKSSTEGSAR